MEGYFLGTRSFLTDEFGSAKGTAQMSATSGTKFYGSILIFNTIAFIDPEFHIDPAWFALNPDTTLSIPEGVGNGMTSVLNLILWASLA